MHYDDMAGRSGNVYGVDFFG